MCIFESLPVALHSLSEPHWDFDPVPVTFWDEREISEPSSVLVLGAGAIFDPLAVFARASGGWFAAIGPFEHARDSEYPAPGVTFRLAVGEYYRGTVQTLAPEVIAGHYAYIPLIGIGTTPDEVAGDPDAAEDDDEQDTGDPDRSGGLSPQAAAVARTESLAIRRQSLIVLQHLAEQILDSSSDERERAVAHAYLGVGLLLAERLDFAAPDPRERALLNLLKVTGTELVDLLTGGQLRRIGMAALDVARAYLAPN